MPTSTHLAARSSIAQTDPARAHRLTANLAALPQTIAASHRPAKVAAPEPPPSRPTRACYRRNSIYEQPGVIAWRRLDRNQRAKLWTIAQGMERNSKRKGARSGCLGYIGLTLLQALLFIYHNTNSGRTDPSYASLKKRTGLCEASIAKAIDALEASGLLVVTRRIMRFKDERGVLVTRQISNAYVFPDPTQVIIPERVADRTCGCPFPSRKDSPLTQALTGFFDKVSGRLYRAAGNLKHPLAPRYATVPR